MTRIGVIIMALAIVGTASSGDLPTPDKLPIKADLPDPLALFEKGAKVTSKEQWENRRRPELKHLFEHYMYGTAPRAPKVNAKVERKAIDELGKDPFDKGGSVRWVAADEKFFLLAAVPYPETPARDRTCKVGLGGLLTDVECGGDLRDREAFAETQMNGGSLHGW